MTPANHNATARKLAALSLDATGAVSAERVRAILDTLAATRKPVVLRPLLKAYRAALARELAKREAHIEHAGPLPPDAPLILAAYFSRIYNRPVVPHVAPNPALLLGLRVRIGDDVFDASSRAILDKLAAS
ncbi:MAG: F0F1 ATP synthase subunit delta [Puniceicoccales bacterium]|jgi:F-type H+-transporting ATPase subunit delta|nr:F0F1 ATP synthase subunit delta [Puniceicoccales bacterium]